MSFGFDAPSRGEGFMMHASGEAEEYIWKIADMLELDEAWPVIPLMLENFYAMLQMHQTTGENLRDVFVIDQGTKNAGHICDLEQLKIVGKAMQLKGLGDPEGEGDEFL